MVDQLLGGLFGSSNNDDAVATQTKAQDFVNRFETGAPQDGCSHEEAAQNYRAATSGLTPQQYQAAASDSFGRMSHEERRQLRQEMRQRSGGRLDPRGDDPGALAQAASQFRQQNPGGGGLASLFGGGGGSSGGAGGGGLGELMNNPLAKVAMGGIAAAAMKKMMGR